MSVADIPDRVYAGTSTKWKGLFEHLATSHRQAVTAEQEAHPDKFVHEPKTGLTQQFPGGDCHSLDFAP
jgi:hypothetical protein